MSPRARLSLFWLLYMAGMGLVFPYQALYFRENAGLSGTQLGLLLGVRPLMGMLFQPFWGQVADRTGSRTRVLAGIAVANSLLLALLPMARGFAPLLLAMAGAALFGTSLMPMAISVSMAALGRQATSHFGRVRVWGTVGFLILVVGFPWLLHGWQQLRNLESAPGGPSEPGLGLLFLLAALLTLAAAGVAWTLPARGALVARAQRGDLRRLLRHGPYLRLLVFTFSAYLCLQGPILLFPVLVRAHGGDVGTLSRMWIPMLLLEIPLVSLSGANLRRVGARGLLAIGVAADGLRWLGCSLAPSLAWIYALQLLHGVVVAGLILGIALYVESVVPERLRSTGQGLVAMLGISFAAMLSASSAGWLLDHFGTVAPYRVGGAGALLLSLAVPWLLPRPSRPPDSPVTEAHLD